VTLVCDLVECSKFVTRFAKMERTVGDVERPPIQDENNPEKFSWDGCATSFYCAMVFRLFFDFESRP